MISRYSDHAANERTFLAWVRTTIAIVGFGLVAERMAGPSTQVWSEVLLLATGAVVVFLAYLRMRHVRRRIDAEAELDDEALPSESFLMLLVTSLFALLAVFATHVS